MIPSVAQVFGTQPMEFLEKFPTTSSYMYAIIDGSEVFIETPSDLHLQPSTWSQYKQNNTVKFLVACTPNGAIFYICCERKAGILVKVHYQGTLTLVVN